MAELTVRIECRTSADEFHKQTEAKST